MLEATLFLQKFPETRNRNRYLFSGKISETRAQGKLAPHPLLCACAVGPAGTAVVPLRASVLRVVQTRFGVCEQRCVLAVNVVLVEYLDAYTGLLYANRTEIYTHSRPRTPLCAPRSRNAR